MVTWNAFATAAFSQLTTEQAIAGANRHNYGLSIVDQEGRVLKERSAGAEQIVALMSLIDMVSTARHARPVPIVMDTPLGR